MRIQAPQLGEGKRGVDGHLLYLLRQANAAVQQAVDRELAGMGLSLAQYSALTMINAYDGISNAELSRVSMLRPQSANETAHRLEKSGLIEKRPDPDHGRVIQLVITGRGRGLLKEARERTDAIEEELMARAESIGAAALKQWLVAIAREYAGSGEIHDR